MSVIAGALITAILGGLILYLSGIRQQHFGRLTERRAEVIADLSKFLYQTQRNFIVFTTIAPADMEGRKQQKDQAQQAYNKLVEHYHSNTVWLDMETCDKVEYFLDVLAQNMQAYMNDLDAHLVPQSKSAHEIGLWMKTEIPVFRRDLENQFRITVYPPPWYEAPLQFLAQLQPRNLEPSDTDPKQTDSKEAR